MQIDWWTIAIQAVNFVILVWLLRRFLYGPVKAVIAKRRALAEDVLAKAAAKEGEAEALKARLEEERSTLAQERRQMLKNIQDQATEAQGKAMEMSRAEAERLMEEAQTSVAREREETLSGLKAEIAAIATDLAADILRQSDATELGTACFERLAAHLDGIGNAERDALIEDAAGTGISIATAQPLADTAQEKWRAMLADHFGSDLPIRFELEEALIGGAELRFPHSVLKFTWAERLAHARRTLEGDDVAA